MKSYSKRSENRLQLVASVCVSSTPGHVQFAWLSSAIGPGQEGACEADKGCVLASQSCSALDAGSAHLSIDGGSKAELACSRGRGQLDPYLNGDGTSLPGQVGQRAGVMAVDLPGKAATKRAGALRQFGRGDDGDAVGRGQNLHDRKIRWDQRQDTTGQGGKSDLQR